MKIALIILAFTAVAGLLVAGCSSVRGGYESAPYQVVHSAGKFELRNYPTLVVVEAPMRGADDSFRRLFRFIGGQNAAQQKISMTTPVYMAGDSTNATMAFVMPKTMSVSQTPQPRDPGLTVKEIGGGQFAVLRFSGSRSRSQETNALAKLEQWLLEQKLQAVGSPIYGYFDPPWTPSFWRRNEVMLRVDSVK